MKLPLLTAALGVAAFVPFVHAQLVPVSAPWPSTLGASGTFRSAETGHLTVDGNIDLVVERGGAVVLCSAIGVYSSFFELDDSANHFDVLHRGSPLAGDAVAIVDDTGLTLHWLSSTGDSFDSLVLDGAAWANAVRVRCDDADGFYADDIVGLAADRRTFLACVSAEGATFVPAAPVTVPNEVSDFVLIQWDADPALEIAMLTSVGLEIRDSDGTFLTDVRDYPAGGRLVAVGVSGTSQQKIAWVTLHPNGVNELLVVGDASGFDATQVMAPLQTVGLEAADVDGDGGDDLIITGKSGYRALIAFQQSGSPSFWFGASTFVIVALVEEDPWAPAPYLETALAAADVDGDGDIDLVCPIDRPEPQADLVSRVESTVIAAATLKPVLPFTFEYVYEGDELIGQADLLIDLMAPEAPDSEIPAEATHVDLIVWRSDGDGESPTRVAIQHDTIDLASPEGQFPIELAVAIDEPQWPFAAIYSLEIRYVERNAEGGIVQAFPARIGTFSADSLLVESWHLNPALSVYSAVIPDESGGGGGGGGSQQQQQGGDPPQSSVEAGGFIETPLIPSFVVNEIEDPGEPEVPMSGS